MSSVTYEIVQHDGGWAYRVDGVFSETYASHDAAAAAARRAAYEQRQPGAAARIRYEDERGVWRDEMSAGEDRPETSVRD